MQVPSAVLQKLVCERCGGFLSRGPVHLLQNRKYRCGRCPWIENADDEEGIRVEAYEELAQLMTFPCRYKENGCTTQVPFLDNKHHEEACPYREDLCPIAEPGQCDWSGLQKEVLGHCQQDHPAKGLLESSGQGTSGSSTTQDLVTSPGKMVEVEVLCSKCLTETAPVYRGDWLCKKHAPEQRRCKNTSRGCTYSDLVAKCEGHELYFCQYTSRCDLCSKDITGTTLDSHYGQAHRDIVHRTGSVFSVSPITGEEWLIIDSDFGRAVCEYWLFDSNFVLGLFTSLPSAELYKYRCTVDLGHPDTGHTLTRTAAGLYSSQEDWHVCVPRSDYNTYVHDEKVNMRINIAKINDPSQFIA